MATIEKRLSDLEAVHGGAGGSCLEGGARMPLDENRLKFVWRGRTREGAQDEWCSWCGRPLVIVLHWGE